MAYTVAPYPYHTFLDDDGAVAAGYKLYTYESGTTTNLATYSDSAGTANANPIVLDSEGRAKIFLSGNAYKFVLKTAADVVVWTIDDVSATPEFDVDLDIVCTAGEAISAGECCYCSAGDGALTAGRWYLADSDLTYGSIGATKIGFAPADIASGAEGTMRVAGRVVGLAGLAAGSVYYASATAGSITATKPVNDRVVGVADSATSVVIINEKPRTVPEASAHVDTSAVGNIGAGADDLITYAVPANTLGVDGQSLRIVCWGTCANNADAKEIIVYFGTEVLLTGTMTVSQAGQWQVGVIILRTGAATQVGLAQIIEGTASADLTLSAQEITAPTETLTGAVTFKLTGEATTTDDIIQSGMILKVV